VCTHWYGMTWAAISGSLITHAALGEVRIEPLLLTRENRVLESWNCSSGQGRLRNPECLGLEDPDNDQPPAHPLWELFLQQAVGKEVSLRLNGWRRPLSEPKGTLLVVRTADFDEFQRDAPDLASFIGLESTTVLGSLCFVREPLSRT